MRNVPELNVDLLQPPYAEGERLACLLVSRRQTRAERVQVEGERGAFARARREAAVRLLVHEDRVGCADLHADTRSRGHIHRVKRVGTPAEKEGADRETSVVIGEACGR